MASPALSTKAPNANPAVSMRPGSVRPAQSSSPTARKSTLRKSQHGMTKQTPPAQNTMWQMQPEMDPRRRAMQGIKPPWSMRDTDRLSQLNQSRRKPSFTGSGESEKDKLLRENNQNDANEQEIPSETNNEPQPEIEEKEANEAESRSTLQSDQLRARTQETAQQQANVQTQKAEPRKRIVKEAAVYAFGFIIDTINITTAGGGLIGTILPKAVILGHDGLRMFFGGKIEGIEPLSWDPLPFSLVDPNANFKMAWTIIKFIILIVLTICTMTLIGIVGYGFAHPLEAVQTFGPAFAQIFVR